MMSIATNLVDRWKITRKQKQMVGIQSALEVKYKKVTKIDLEAKPLVFGDINLCRIGIKGQH